MATELGHEPAPSGKVTAPPEQVVVRTEPGKPIEAPKDIPLMYFCVGCKRELMNYNPTPNTDSGLKVCITDHIGTGKGNLECSRSGLLTIRAFTLPANDPGIKRLEETNRSDAIEKGKEWKLPN